MEKLKKVPEFAPLDAGVYLVDTHCHIDGEEYEDDRAEMIERAAQAGVKKIVNFGDTLANSERSVKVAAEFANVYTGVGVHPNEVFQFKQADADYLAELSKNPHVVAIGEIGLDYYWEKDSDVRKLQREMFVKQLALARDLDLPVCIHDREAHGDLMTILKTEGRRNRGVIHCFSGSWEMAKELLKLGWYLGIDGPITYKNAKKGLEIVKNIPLDRLLVETDCPYLTPEPYRGRRNEPAMVRLVAEFAADLRGENLADFARQTTQNAIDVYGM